MNVGMIPWSLALALLLPSALQAQRGTRDTTRRKEPEEHRHYLKAPEIVREEDLNQGTVTIRTENGAHLRIYREDLVIGLTPEQLKQRSGTKRFYQVRDVNDVKVCGDTITIEAPYQSVEVICEVKSGHLKPSPATKP